VPYDPGPLFAAFEEREVPERAVITATFFDGSGSNRIAEYNTRGRDPELRVPGHRFAAVLERFPAGQFFLRIYGAGIVSNSSRSM
jgi:hypothetical protein